ncbi:MAG TPA: homoserine kinase [Anaerolineae bacterium]|nr:homoserine kinase [Anaerolineae bacterium]
MVHVTVPASTANLGPGFDCLGLALGLHNTLVMTALDDGFELSIAGEGADRLRKDRDNLIVRAAETLWQHVGRRPAGLKIEAVNRIPPGMGLGSSAAAIVSGLVAANALVGKPLAKRELLQLAARIEGHADNVAAALFGGLTLVSAHAEDILVDALAVPPLQVVIAAPGVRLSTREARAALPTHVSRADAVFNIGRALFVVRALQSGNYDLLNRAMADRLHEPHRRKLIPGFDAVERAARAAGAVAVALSGAGPSLAAFAPDRQAEIASAMRAAFEASGVTCRTFVLAVDQQGASLERRAP